MGSDRTSAGLVLRLLAGAMCACDAPAAYVGFDATPCTPDPSRHDEDGDGLPDSCDVCPIVADPLQRDSTEADKRGIPDGVGDACDFAPGSSGDRLVALYTLVDRDASEWTGSGWHVMNDAATAEAGGSWVANETEVGDGLAVMARFASWGAQGTIQLVTDGDPDNGGLVCSVVRDLDGDGRDELRASQYMGATASTSLPTRLEPFTLSAWRSIDRYRVSRLQCRVQLATSTHIAAITAIDDTVTGGYSLLSSGPGRVSGIAVYTQPVDPCLDGVRCDRPDSP